MTTLEALAMIALVHIAHAFAYTSEAGVTYTYTKPNTNKCRKEGKIATKSDVTLARCVEECGLRQHCSGVNYKKRFQLCELFASATGDDFSEGDCIFIPASDISVSQNPCEGSDCTNGKACDIDSSTCMFKECPSIVGFENGEIKGNMLDVGSKIKFSCNDGYKEKNGITYGVCLASGQWYPTAECVPDCGDPPAIINGVASRDVSDEDIYSVICDVGFQGSKETFQCLQPGTWEVVTCDRIACGRPTAISNSDISLNTPGGILYLDTATVTCHAGYESSAGQITCASNGSWGSLTCEPISCGNPPLISNGNITLHTLNGNFYLDTASVVCDELYKASSNSIFCTAAGSWENAVCTECYQGTPWEYEGVTNHTSHGIPCIRWQLRVPDTFIIEDYFPGDETIEEANNYCRNPYSSSFNLWCYTGYGGNDYGFCGITKCD